MNRSYIDTHLAVDRYLLDALSDGELAEFEERLVWDQELMDEVDLAQTLREGLRAHLEKNESPTADSGFWDKLGVFVNAPAYAAAASFLVAVGLTYFAMTSLAPGPNPLPLPGSARTEIVPLFTTRTTSSIEVTVSESAWTVLLVDAPQGYRSLRSKVTRHPADTVVWSRDDLTATYPESLALGMPSSLLEEGEYTLLLEGVAQDASSWQTVQTIPFRVSRSE